MKCCWAATAALTAILAGFATVGRAQELVPEEDAEVVEPAPPGRLVIAPPTLGGKQLWADERFFHKWRIQRNVLTGHFRLLDENNRRYASGTYQECTKTLDQIRRERRLPPMQGHGVVVLHGLADSREAMASLCRYLEDKGGYAVFNVGYPSTRRSIGDHAKALARIVENLHGIESIDFVGHSLGNIVIRHYLADQTDERAGRRPDSRIRRMVMLGPPNHGSEIATSLRDSKTFRLILGKPGQELGHQWVWEESQLAIPRFEFGIVAGGKGNDKGYNPLLPGDDDGIVTVAGTRLPGAADFIVVPTLHALLPRDAKIHEYVLRFLQHGYFVSSDQRRPIGKEER